MYQRFQNLRQGPRSFDDYTTEFYQLLARTDLKKSPVQLVSHYIGGLRLQLQDTLNMFDPLTVAEAHQRASQVEKQLARRENVNFRQPSSSTSASTGSSTSPGQKYTEQSPPPPVRGPSQGSPGGGMRCFSCGESGHRQADYRKAPVATHGLFTNDTVAVDPDHLDDKPIYDDYPGDEDVHEEYVAGDTGLLLML